MIFKKWKQNKAQQLAHYERLEKLLELTNLKLAQIETRLILNAPTKPKRIVI